MSRLLESSLFFPKIAEQFAPGLTVTKSSCLTLDRHVTHAYTTICTLTGGHVEYDMTDGAHSYSFYDMAVRE